MTLTLHADDRVSNETWDEVWLRSPAATYFQSREWAEVWAASRPSDRPAPELVRFSDGASALLPITLRNGSHALLSPAGTYGGWLTTDALTPRHVELLTRHLLRRHDSLSWRLNPFDEGVGALRGVTLAPDHTHAIDLSPGMDVIRRAWTKGHRSAVSKAKREGVLVALAETVEEWAAYFAIYQDSLRRWGERATSRYDWQLFAALHARRSPHVRLWLATFRGEPIAGALVLHSSRHAAYWHGAALEEFFPLRPVHLLVSEALTHACGAGLRWFDFNPSGGHEGVEGFKRGFGAISLDCGLVRSEAFAARWLRRAATIKATLSGRGHA